MLTGEFLRLSARRAPQRLAVIGSGRRLTYRELDAAANRFAHGLLRLGIVTGGRIAIMASNRPEYAIAYFGAARAGVLLAHISLRSTADNLAYMLGKIGAEALIHESRCAAVVDDALPRLSAPPFRVIIDQAGAALPAGPADAGPPAGPTNAVKPPVPLDAAPPARFAGSAPRGGSASHGAPGEPQPTLRHRVRADYVPGGTGSNHPAATISLDELLDGAPDTHPDIGLSETDPLGITFTGGTTGFPKAVLVTHKARAATAYAAAVDFGLSEADIVAATTPMFHCAGLFVWFAPAIMLGATVVTQPTWDAARFVELTERERITAAFFVPSQLNDLISHPAFSARRLRTLRNIGYAGAPMGRALLERVQAALPHVAFTENYGQSETCPLTVRRPEHGAVRLGTVGRPAFNVELDVVDPDGRPVAAGRVGEIVTRGDQLFECYFGDEQQTRAAFPRNDGWLWTGDLGFFDEDGFLTLVDRSRDMLVSGGENIYPAEIENALYSHEAVAECAVFGIPDDHWGEVPAAHVVLGSGRHATEDELIGFCAERIPRHKRPRLVRFVDALPRTAVGKIRKNILREPYWRDREKKI